MSENQLIKLDGVQNLLSNIGNKIIENKTLMRCLQYNTPDALSQPEVTLEQIKKLVGKGSDPANEQRLFKVAFYNNNTTDPRTELRFFLPTISADNIYLAAIKIGFQVIVHNSSWELDENKQRPLVILNEILKEFNGDGNIGGIGSLQLRKEHPIEHFPFNSSFSGYYMCLYTRTI